MTWQQSESSRVVIAWLSFTQFRRLNDTDPILISSIGILVGLVTLLVILKARRFAAVQIDHIESALKYLFLLRPKFSVRFSEKSSLKRSFGLEN